MPPEFFEDGHKRKHVLEERFKAPAWDILSAIEHGHRARTDAKGKLAEFYLDLQFQDALSQGTISSYRWSDRDGEPDFILEIEGRTFRLEVKNVRSDDAVYPDGYKVELQKTRNQLSGDSKLRGYPASKFDILAACLFNQTDQWEYLFVATRHLERLPEHPDWLVVFHKIPYSAQGVWKGTLAEIIKKLVSGD